jgi:protein-S-isoprenylcysteine O-methyltransferase Ste14
MSWILSAFIIIIFFGLYAVVHSLLATFGAKNWARQMFGPGADRWYRLAYNLFAIITLLPLFPLLALLPAQTLYIVPIPWLWLMLAGQLLALVGLAIALWQTGPGHFLGLAQLVASRPNETSPLSVSGFYAWVRHPLYSFSLLFLWLTPAMNTNLLIAYLVFTLYFYVGSIFEERRLLAEFGPAYQTYRQRVPRLIPMRLPRRVR